MQLTSPSFGSGEKIGRQFTCDGEDQSPELVWTTESSSVKSFALILEDPDAPSGLFTHWIVFDIPSTAKGLAAGAADVGTPGRNDFRKVGYGGPCPPPQGGEHRYFFRLYALDIPSLDLAKGATRQQVLAAMQGHILGQAELMGRYSRHKK